MAIRTHHLIILLSGLLAACTAARKPDAVAARDEVEAAIEAAKGVADFESVTARGAMGQLVEYREWIYFKAPGMPYRRVVPGTCPQWYGRYAKDQFLVFLPVGYDGVSEIWLASTSGQLHGKLAEGTVNINSSPHLAPSLNRFVHVIRPTAQIAGDLSHVELVYFPRNANGQLERQTLYTTTPDESVTDLHFKDEETVEFVLNRYDESDQLQHRRIELNVR